MRQWIFGAAMAAAVAFAGGALAQGPREAALVSADWLAAHANDANLVILHVGDEAGYRAGHIPGARLVSANALAVTGPAPGNLTLEMPDAATIEQRLEELGVSDNSRVVVVFTNPNQLPAATRVVFTLEIAGLRDRVSLLDGGQGAWQRAGRTLVAANDGEGSNGGPRESAAPARGDLSPLSLEGRIVDAAFVQQHLASPGYKVVDARASAFYDGSQAGGGRGGAQPRGHILDALSVPFNSLTNADGTYKSEAELRSIFAAAGVRPGDKLIVYCHVGQQATAVIFAARTLGVETMLYDGSYQDWSNRQLPVTGPAA